MFFCSFTFCFRVSKLFKKNQEYSAQEALSLFNKNMATQWLRKIFPGVIYVNTNNPEKRFRLLRS